MFLYSQTWVWKDREVFELKIRFCFQWDGRGKGGGAKWSLLWCKKYMALVTNENRKLLKLFSYFYDKKNDQILRKKYQNLPKNSKLAK